MGSIRYSLGVAIRMGLAEGLSIFFPNKYVDKG
jgi:hypothetical protein